MLFQRVKKTIEDKKLLLPGEGVVIGVSGGADSVCLLHILAQLRSVLNLSLHVLHINHMLRGTESQQDMSYVQELCDAWQIPATCLEIDIAKIADKDKISQELAGRNERYRAFRTEQEKLRHKTGTMVKIAVAHHRSDQAETVLMNILRGTGVNGLVGMRFEDHDIIRPLLHISKAEIVAYNDHNGLCFQTDSTNDAPIYTRNQLRLELMPLLKEQYNPKIEDALVKLSQIAAWDRDYLTREAQEALEAGLMKPEDIDAQKEGLFLREMYQDGLFFSLEKLAAQHQAILSRVIRIAGARVRENAFDIHETHVTQVMHLIERGETGKELHLPSGLRILKSYQMLIFFSDTQVGVIHKDGFLDNTKIVKSFMKNDFENIEDLKNIGYNALVQYFDAESLCPNELVLRTRMRGDRFFPLRSSGKKKLKKYFIDKKIPKDVRDFIPLVTIGDEVVWVIGYQISETYKVKDDTKTIIKIQYINNVVSEGEDV